MPRQVFAPLASKISPVPTNYITFLQGASIGICKYLCWLMLMLALMSWPSSLVGLWYATDFSLFQFPSKLMIMHLLSNRDI